MKTDEAVRRLEEIVRRKHLALAAERTYGAWLRQYCDFLKGLPLHLPSEHKLERFLTILTQNNVAASTQNQAFNVIIPNSTAKHEMITANIQILLNVFYFLWFGFKGQRRFRLWYLFGMRPIQ